MFTDGSTSMILGGEGERERRRERENTSKQQNFPLSCFTISHSTPKTQLLHQQKLTYLSFFFSLLPVQTTPRVFYCVSDVRLSLPLLHPVLVLKPSWQLLDAPAYVEGPGPADEALHLLQ